MTAPDDDAVQADDELIEDLRASGRGHDPHAADLLGLNDEDER